MLAIFCGLNTYIAEVDFRIRYVDFGVGAFESALRAARKLAGGASVYIYIIYISILGPNTLYMLGSLILIPRVCSYMYPQLRLECIFDVWYIGQDALQHAVL